MSEEHAALKQMLHINNGLIEELRTPYRPFAGQETSERYIAFLDILGFGNAVRNRFEETLRIYENMLDKLRILRCFELGVSINVVSASIVLSSASFDALMSICKLAQAITLLENCLVRGGVGHGRHVDIQDGENRYIVSQALVNAVVVEKTTRWPCVAIDERITIPSRHWAPRTEALRRSIVHYQGLNLVCPLNPFWGSTALDRVRHMRKIHPEHSDKFDWFLEFAEQILMGADLVPKSYAGP